MYAFYGWASDGKGASDDGSRVGGLTKGSDTGSQQWEISYTYPLSKRTQVYAGYVKMSNDRNAAYTFNINSYTINTTCTGNGFDHRPELRQQRQAGRLRARHDPPVLSITDLSALTGASHPTGACGRPFFFARANPRPCDERG